MENYLVCVRKLYRCQHEQICQTHLKLQTRRNKILPVHLFYTCDDFAVRAAASCLRASLMLLRAPMYPSPSCIVPRSFSCSNSSFRLSISISSLWRLSLRSSHNIIASITLLLFTFRMYERPPSSEDGENEDFLFRFPNIDSGSPSPSESSGTENSASLAVGRLWLL